MPEHSRCDLLVSLLTQQQWTVCVCLSRNDTFIVQDTNSYNQEKASFVRGEETESKPCNNLLKNFCKKLMFPHIRPHLCETGDPHKEVVTTPEHSFSIPQILIFLKNLECLATLFALVQSLSYLVEFRKSNLATANQRETIPNSILHFCIAEWSQRFSPFPSHINTWNWIYLPVLLLVFAALFFFVPLHPPY